MSSSLLMLIQTANAEISAFIRNAGSEPDAPVPAGLSTPPLDPLLRRLEQVGESLRTQMLQAALDPEVRTELSRYTENLQRLRPALEVVGRRLLLRRASLDIKRNRLRGLNQWVAATQSTRFTSPRRPGLQVTIAD
jgi:hypothetical protein